MSEEGGANSIYLQHLAVSSLLIRSAGAGDRSGPAEPSIRGGDPRRAAHLDSTCHRHYRGPKLMNRRQVSTRFVDEIEANLCCGVFYYTPDATRTYSRKITRSHALNPGKADLLLCFLNSRDRLTSQIIFRTVSRCRMSSKSTRTPQNPVYQILAWQCPLHVNQQSVSTLLG